MTIPQPLERTPITIVGAGPVGMLLAYQLSLLNVPCLLTEQSLETTKWPKMDLTNPRVMEMLRVLGLADEYRGLEGSVGENMDFDSSFVTRALGDGRLLGSWKRPTVKEQREYIQQTNDGSQPAEPSHRCMQIIFEAWLKELILTKTHVQSRFGWKYLSHVENGDGVVTKFVDIDGQTHTVRSKYLIGCDGGSSRVRKTAGIKMVGGQIPARFYLVHFRSQELAEKLTFGRSWHIFPIHSGFIIDQDGKDTFTAHYPVTKLPPGTKIDPREVVYRTLDGKFKIDEVLVHSEWTPNFSIAKQYHTDSLRVLLAGDAAHRVPPHGGYGMNTGVMDALDLGWRLAALHKGYGEELLLRAYDLERRPIMVRALERSLRHLWEHVKLGEMYAKDADILESDTPAGEEVRTQIKQFIDDSGPDTVDLGIELDLRYYEYSPLVYHDGSDEHEWDVKRYIPSTRPGCRTPHVFLKDGVTSTYDFFGLGPEWTLIHFINGDSPDQERASDVFMTVSMSMSFPLKRVFLHNEEHVYRIYEGREMVLVRPDTHVAWRSQSQTTLNHAQVERILQVVSGWTASPRFVPRPGNVDENFRRLVAEFTDMHSGSGASNTTILGE